MHSLIVRLMERKGVPVSADRTTRNLLLAVPVFEALGVAAFAYMWFVAPMYGTPMFLTLLWCGLVIPVYLFVVGRDVAADARERRTLLAVCLLCCLLTLVFWFARESIYIALDWETVSYAWSPDREFMTAISVLSAIVTTVESIRLMRRMSSSSASRR